MTKKASQRKTPPGDQRGAVISDEMRMVVENEWPEFIHKVQRIARG